MFACMNEYMYVRMYVYMYECDSISGGGSSRMYVCMFVCLIEYLHVGGQRHPPHPSRLQQGGPDRTGDPL